MKKLCGKHALHVPVVECLICELEAKVKELEAALERLGQHQMDCYGGRPECHCTCGLDKALAEGA